MNVCSFKIQYIPFLSYCYKKKAFSILFFSMSTMSTIILRPGGSKSQYLSKRNYSSAIRQQMQTFQQQQYHRQFHHYYHPIPKPVNNNQQTSLLMNNNNTSQNNNAAAPHFEHVSYDKVQDLYEPRKGCFYFIPEGFEPVLVPKAQTVTRLLKSSPQAPNAFNFSKQSPNILYRRDHPIQNHRNFDDEQNNHQSNQMMFFIDDQSNQQGYQMHLPL